MAGGRREEARLRFEEAFRLAERMSWGDAMVVSKLFIAETYSYNGEHGEEERILLEARAICRARSDCKGDQMVSVYNSLLTLYLLLQKDLPKARETVSEMRQNGGKTVGEKQMKEILRDTAMRIREAGYPAEAAKLESELC